MEGNEMLEDNMDEGWEKSYWDGGDDSLKLARKTYLILPNAEPQKN